MEQLISATPCYWGDTVDNAAWGNLEIYGSPLARTASAGGPPSTRTAVAATTFVAPSAEAARLTQYANIRLEFKKIQSLDEREESLAASAKALLTATTSLSKDLRLEEVRNAIKILDVLATLAFFVVPIEGILAAVLKNATELALGKALELVADLAIGEVPATALGYLRPQISTKLAEKLAELGYSKIQFTSRQKAVLTYCGSTGIDKVLEAGLDRVLDGKVDEANLEEYLWYSAPGIYVCMSGLGVLLLFSSVRSPVLKPVVKYHRYVCLNREYMKIYLELATAHMYRMAIDPMAFAQSRSEDLAKRLMLRANVAAPDALRVGIPRVMNQ